MSDQVFISVVSPVYRAEAILPELVNRLHESLSKINQNYEIILVEDGGPDHSWERIEEQCKKDKRVKGIKLSRNFGQHPAILAGLRACKGEWIVVMDCDLQDLPEEISKLYAKAQEGFDLVLALRNNRKDHFFKKMFSSVFYGLLSYLTGSEHDARIANFGIYRKKVIDAVVAMPEYNRYFPVMVRWVGFRQAKTEVEHRERKEGRSSYSFKKYFQLALQIILSFSEKPLYLAIKLGLTIAFLSFAFGIFLLYRAFMHHITVEGWASTMVSIWFLGGLIISIIGVVGLYIGKTFEQVRHRPTFIVDKNLNIEKDA